MLNTGWFSYVKAAIPIYMYMYMYIYIYIFKIILCVEVCEIQLTIISKLESTDPD